MPEARIGVVLAILQDGRVLLAQREDFEVWNLPGGAVEAGESLAQAAVREAWEETGVQAQITHLVGLYSRPHWRDGLGHIALFAARPVGGVLVQTTDETINAGYFGLDDLPSPLMWGHRVMIEDALSGKQGVVRAQQMAGPSEVNLPRRDLYALRDRSGLSRQEFYLKLIAPFIEESDSLEVKGLDTLESRL